MVSDLARFQSNAVTQIPSFGIVNRSGDRALAQGIADVGKTFDYIAKDQSAKLDKKMEREMTRRGVEAALEKGFDPSEVAEPNTTADEIYRRSAFKTYGIQLEDDISSNINRLHVQNLRNPEGFKNKSEAYIKESVANLPVELKTGASEYALGIARSKYNTLALDQQRRVIAETEATEKVHLEKLGDKIRLAETPEEKSALFEQARASVETSTRYLTRDGKEGAFKEFEDAVLKDDALDDVFLENATPNEVIDRLEGQGIALDAKEISSLYSLVSQKQNFDEKQIQLREAKRQRAVTEETNAVLTEAFDANEEDLGEIGFDQFYEEGLQRIREKGANPEEIIDFKQTLTNAYYGETVDNDSVKTLLDQMTFEADPDTPDKIAEYQSKGLLTPATAQQYKEDFARSSSSINTNPVIKSYITNEFIPSYAPLASYSSSDAQLFDSPQMREAYLADKAKIAQLENQVIDMFNGTEKVPGKNAREIVNELQSFNRANLKEVGAGSRVVGTSDAAVKARQILSQENFTIKVVGNKEKEDVLDTIEGPWDITNWETRLNEMIKQNRRARSRGTPEPYSEETLREINRAWSGGQQ